MRRPAALLLLSSLTACSGGLRPSPPVCFAPAPVSTNPTLVRSGSPTSIGFAVTGCPRPERVEASVLDPRNQVVESTTVLDGVTGTVTFTPRVGGPYHVVARFQPNLGIGQADLSAVPDRSAEPGVLVPLPLEAPIELTDAGVLVAGRAVYFLSNDGPVLLRQFAVGVTPFEDVLWGADVGQLGRFVVEPEPDGGARLRQSPAEPIVTQDAGLFPARDDVVLLSPAGAFTQAAVATDGGWVRRALPTLTTATAWFHRFPDQLVALTRGNQRCALDVRPDAGSPLSVGFGCRFWSLPYTQRIGGELDGIWLTDSEDTGLAFHRDSVSFTLPVDGRLSPGVTPVLSLGGEDVVPVVTDELRFEYWGSPVVSASPRTIATRVDGGTLLHLPRP